MAQHNDASKAWLALLASINVWGGLTFGYNTGIIAAALDPLTDDFELTSFLKGVVASAVVFGAMLGSIIGATLCDRLGRKWVLIISSILVIISCLASAFPPDGNQKVFVILVLIRIVLGMGIGLVSVVCPLYVSEMSPEALRGVFGTFFQLAITFGIVIAYVGGLGLQQMPHKYQWRTMLELGALPAVFQLMVSIVIPESSVWMHEKRNRSNERSGLLSGEPEKQGWLSLLHPRNWRVTLTAFMLALALQMTGINAVMYYAPDIFKSAGVEKGSIYYVTIGVGVWNFLTTFIAVAIVDRYSRRTLLLGGLVIMVVADFVAGISALAIPNPYGAYVSLVCIFVFIAGFEGSMGTLFWIVINEMFPNDIREVAASLANALQWAFNLAIALLFPLAVAQIGLGTTYIIFAGIGVTAIIYVFFCVPETKSANKRDSYSLEGSHVNS